MAEWLIHEVVFWAWCRWLGHESFPVEYEWFTNGPDRVTVRICWGCGRVYPDDVETALDALSRELDEQEAAAQGGGAAH